MAKMPTGCHLRPGNPVWQQRIMVPKDLRHLHGDRATIRVTLDTRDGAVARRESHRIQGDWTVRFSAERRAATATTVDLTPALLDTIVLRISDRQRWSVLAMDDAIRANLLDEYLQWMEQVAPPLRFFDIGTAPVYLMQAGQGMTPEKLARLREIQDTVVRLLSTDLRYLNLSLAETHANAAVHPLGFRVDWSTPAGRLGLVAVMRTMVSAWALAAERSTNVQIETPQRPPELSRDGLGLSVPPGDPVVSVYLRDVVPFWDRSKRRSPDALKRMNKAVALFTEAVGDVPLKDIDSVHGDDFRAWLLDAARPWKSKTAKNHWISLISLLTVAKTRKLVQRNEWADETLAVHHEDEETRYPFKDAELHKLFGSRLFTHGTWDEVRHVDPEDAYWVLLILFWTGSRVSEVTKRLVDDVEDVDGLKVLSFAKGVKNKSSIRKVPFAADLIRLGVLDFVKRRKEAQATHLFPSFVAGGTDRFGPWMRQYRETVGLPAGSLESVHRFRHTIRTLLDEQGVSPTVASAITGHSKKGDAGQMIYTHARLLKMSEDLGSLSNPVALEPLKWSEAGVDSVNQEVRLNDIHLGRF